MAGVILSFGLKNEWNLELLANFCSKEALNACCVDVGGSMSEETGSCMKRA
jgi:hypothetical protein